MAVYIFEKVSQIKDFYNLNFKVWLNQEVHFVEDPSLFKNLVFQENPKLIITRDKYSGVDIKHMLESVFNERQVSVPTIYIKSEIEESDETNDKNELSFKSALKIQPIIKRSADMLQITASYMANLKVQDYYPLSIDLLIYIQSSPVNIYYEKNGSQELLFSMSQKIDHKKIEFFKNKNIENIFCEAIQRVKLCNCISSGIVREIDFEKLNQIEKLHAQEMGQKLVHREIRDIGFTEENILQAKKQISQMIKVASKTKSMKLLLQRLLKSESGYLYKHSQLLVYITGKISAHLDWGSDEIKNKLAFMAFYHDISLENDIQARIHSKEELEKSEIPAAEKQLILKHAQVTAEIIAKYPKAPIGIDAILRQHHGVLNGYGFADEYPLNLAPLSIVFILAEAFVHELIDQGDNLKISQALLSVKKKFAKTRMQRHLKYLDDAFGLSSD